MTTVSLHIQLEIFAKLPIATVRLLSRYWLNWCERNRGLNVYWRVAHSATDTATLLHASERLVRHEHPLPNTCGPLWQLVANAIQRRHWPWLAGLCELVARSPGHKVPGLKEDLRNALDFFISDCLYGVIDELADVQEPSHEWLGANGSIRSGTDYVQYLQSWVCSDVWQMLKLLAQVLYITDADPLDWESPESLRWLRLVSVDIAPDAQLTQTRAALSALNIAIR